MLPDQTSVKWIDTFGGPFICLPERSRLSWAGYSNPDVDPLDQSHDYGRACALPGYAAVLAVDDCDALVFGEAKPITLWFDRQQRPTFVEWVYAENDDAVLHALRHLPADLSPESTTPFRVPDDELVVFDSVMSGREYDDHGSFCIRVDAGTYTVGSVFYKPDDETGLIVHCFRASN